VVLLFSASHSPKAWFLSNEMRILGLGMVLPVHTISKMALEAVKFYKFVNSLHLFIFFLLLFSFNERSVFGFSM
jgi:hypothetical protein